MSTARWREPAWLALPSGVVLGAVMAALDARGNWTAAWLAYGLLLAAGMLLVALAWRHLDGSRSVLAAAIAAFAVRLGAGLALTLLLPVFGYQDSQVTRAGYLFYDAFIRDQQAWELARSSRPLLAAFQGAYSGDQYGGMLALSALVYRYLSPDAHRPAVILILTATTGALACVFLWKSARSWFPEGLGLAAAWILALYPEAVFLSGSQMREAFLMLAVAMSLYGLIRVMEGGLRSSAWLFVSAVLLFLFSPLAALPVFGILAGLWALDGERRWSWPQAGLFAGGLLVALAVVITFLAQYPSLERAGPWRVMLEWFQYNFGFQAHLLERSSGWVQKLFEEAGQLWETPIVVLYGLARPVLPATLVEPAPWIWRLIGSLRAAGWYALAPLLFYGATRLLHPQARDRRPQLLWLSLALWLWILAAALVGGGDQTDNPRYRTIPIAWLALQGAWAWWWARRQRDPWLGRWLLAEGVFLIFFTQWYLSRHYRLFGRLPFWWMVAAILGISALILIGGWWRDRQARARPHSS